MDGQLVEALEPRTLLSAPPVLLHTGIYPTSAQVVVANGIRFFIGSDAEHGENLWRTDGRPSGTRMVVDLKPGAQSPLIRDLTPFRSWVYFIVDDKSVWRSDGTAAGTTVVLTTDLRLGPLSVSGNALYAPAKATIAQLWRINGAPDGTVNLLAGNPALPRGVSDLLGIGDRAYLKVEVPKRKSIGYELWTSDGTAAGTQRIQSLSSEARFIGSLRGRLFFTDFDVTTSLSLYRTEGTAAAVKLKSLVPFQDSFEPSLPAVGSAVVHQGKLYFGVAAYRDYQNRAGIWSTDGTAAGTGQVVNLDGVGQLATAGSTIYFVGPATYGGGELWKTDGTAAGTAFVKDIRPGSASSSILEMTDVNGTLYFVARDALGSVELWRSDGTAAGTVRLTSMRGGDAATQLVSGVGSLSFIGGSIYFTAHPHAAGIAELFRWRVDEITAAAAGSISGVAFNDLDQDGRRDAGEPPVHGIRVFIDADANRYFDPDTETSVFTASNGRYRFADLPPGDYTIMQEEHNGWASETAKPHPVHIAAPGASGITVLPQARLDLPYTVAASVSGSAFIDLNGNGRRDSNDPPATYMMVGLEWPTGYGIGSGTIGVQTDGRWRFDNLPVGRFHLNARAGGKTYEVEIPDLYFTTHAGQALTNYEFALRRRE